MIEVISAGLYSSIQDEGRFKYRKFGIPLSGVMDHFSAELANKLVGNKTSAPLLEIIQQGPVLKFKVRAIVAITGAGFTPTIDSVAIPLNTRILVSENATLKFGLPTYGVRAYLAIEGGIASEKIMGSMSQYGGITKAHRLEKGDILKWNSSEAKTIASYASVKVNKEHFSSEVLQVYPGPEFKSLPPNFQQKITKNRLQVLQESNRMAYLCSGWEDLSAAEIITAPVQPGTVQLTPSGQCIILMRDAQTTGGYARVLQLSNMAISRLSQKGALDSIQFELI